MREVHHGPVDRSYGGEGWANIGRTGENCSSLRMDNDREGRYRLFPIPTELSSYARRRKGSKSVDGDLICQTVENVGSGISPQYDYVVSRPWLSRPLEAPVTREQPR